MKVMQLNQRAAAAFPIERHWLSEIHVRRAMREYDAADRIVIASQYARDSFVSLGIPADRLVRRALLPHARFIPATRQNDDGIFRVVYCGSLTVAKGVHLLVRAFATLPSAAELTLIGGWTTRGMRSFLRESIGRDPRIRIRLGDPLPHLQNATAYVHPTYQDGLGMAALEALACGVPVIVTEDTGMKEYVSEGSNGFVVPTGDWREIAERLLYMYQAR